ncbi:MAG: hypothetical protein CM15mP84_06920 [Cellvibrionales bacterium]|nr:MAG: hypothetical protein CM15mP84_06920 [Cellvibrionales bacterium]
MLVVNRKASSTCERSHSLSLPHVTLFREVASYYGAPKMRWMSAQVAAYPPREALVALVGVTVASPSCRLARTFIVIRVLPLPL